MRDESGGAMSRRQAIAGSATGVAAFAAFAFGLREVAAQRSGISSGGGITGGGAVQTANGQAQFAVSGTRLEFDGASEPLIIGSFVWSDPVAEGGPVTLQSTVVQSYGPFSEQAPNARQMTGMVRANGAEAEYPFLLQLEDNGEPGSGADVVNLVVGAAAEPFLATPLGHPCSCDFAYSVKGNVVTGDLHLITIGEA